MADKNSFTLPAASWLDPAEWARATARRRERFLRRVGAIAVRLKRKEVTRGVGVDREPLYPVKPASRPDGADGKPLDPHYGQSRAFRWLRSSVAPAKGAVTLWWSHGWGRILGYHRAGIKRNDMPDKVVKRDTIGLSAPSVKSAQGEARTFWRQVGGKGKADAARAATQRANARVAAPRSFVPSDARAMDRWTAKGFDAWARTLTPGEKTALIQYGGSADRPINARLRGTPGVADPYPPGRVEAMTRALDRAIARGTLPEAAVLWRGLSPRFVGAAGIDPAAIRPGQVLEDRGFASASLLRRVGEKNARGLLLKILAPAGTPAASLQAGVGQRGEREILLGRGLKLRVRSVKKVGRQTVAEVVIVPRKGKGGR